MTLLRISVLNPVTIATESIITAKPKAIPIIAILPDRHQFEPNYREFVHACADKDVLILQGEYVLGGRSNNQRSNRLTILTLALLVLVYLVSWEILGNV